jgi:putative ABC transport system substrate-binding protein
MLLSRHTRRREFITLLGGAAMVWPLAAQAQQSERVRQIGVLMGTSESDPDQKGMVSNFTRALAELGWTEGTNIRIERRWAEGDFARLGRQTSHASRQTPSLRKAHRQQRHYGKQHLRRRWCS